MATALEQAVFLGNGVGVVYYTGPTGVLIPTDPHWSRGEANGGLALKRVRNLATIARKSAYGTAATFTVTMTNAAADNLTVFTIGGVSQITGAVAMTAGNLATSAASIVTALNSYVASLDWSAYSIGATIFVRCNTAGSANNNLPIVLTFSGASTASYPAVTAGGTDSNQFNTRIFLDLNPAADPATLNMGSAVEITSAVAALPPYTTVDVPVVSNAVTTPRQDRNNGIAVTGGGTINNIVIADSILGDIMVIYAKSGEPSATITSGVGNVTLSTGTSFVSTGPSKAMVLEYREVSVGPSTYGWVEASSRIEATPANNNAAGSQVPWVAGVLGHTVLNGGEIFNITIGTGNKSRVILDGTGALTGAVSYPVLVGTANAGDSVTIQPATGSTWTLSGGSMTIAGLAIPVAALTAGLWSVECTVDNAGTISTTLSVSATTANVTGSSQIQPGAITDSKVTDVSGIKLVAGSVPLTALSAAVQAMLAATPELSASVSIPTADVLTLFATPVEIVANPGVNFAIVLSRWTAKMIFATTAYATNTTLRVGNFGAGSVQGSNATFLAAAPPAGTDIHHLCDLVTNATGTQIVQNQPLNVSVATGDPTAGDSDITITVWYRIIAV